MTNLAGLNAAVGHKDTLQEFARAHSERARARNRTICWRIPGGDARQRSNAHNHRHGVIVESRTAERADNVATVIRIASAYSWDERLEEPGIGTVAAIEIQLWFEERGASLRASE